MSLRQKSTGRFHKGIEMWVRKYGDIWAWSVEFGNKDAADNGDAETLVDAAIGAMRYIARVVRQSKPTAEEQNAIDQAAGFPRGAYFDKRLNRVVTPNDELWRREAYMAITGDTVEFGWQLISDDHQARLDLSGQYPRICIRNICKPKDEMALTSLELANITAIMLCEKA